MANYTTMSMFLAVFFSAPTIPTIASRSQELLVATGEMVRANYFAFVMLINMSLDQRLEENITFLMPNDRILSTIMLNQNSVSDFLLRHSIPSPLLFDHLERIPSGSTIPSSKHEYMLHVLNGGRKSFFLNNVKIISRNICTATSSIRCHGIDGVLSETFNSPHSSCSSNYTSPYNGATPPALAPSSPLPAPPLAESYQIPETSPPPDHQHVGARRSGSCRSPSRLYGGSLLLKVLMMYLLWSL